MENGDFWWDISVSHLHKLMGISTMSTPRKQDDAGLDNVSLKLWVIQCVYPLSQMGELMDDLDTPAVDISLDEVYKYLINS